MVQCFLPQKSDYDAIFKVGAQFSFFKLKKRAGFKLGLGLDGVRVRVRVRVCRGVRVRLDDQSRVDLET